MFDLKLQQNGKNINSFVGGKSTRNTIIRKTLVNIVVTQFAGKENHITFLFTVFIDAVNIL